jgi:hypothetical protein
MRGALEHRHPPVAGTPQVSCRLSPKVPSMIPSGPKLKFAKIEEESRQDRGSSEGHTYHVAQPEEE